MKKKDRRKKSFSVLSMWSIVGIVVIVSFAGSALGRRRESATWSFDKITPAKGAWGSVVTLYGRGFSKDAKVFYNDKELKPNSVSGRAIRVTVPEGVKSGWFSIHQAGRELSAPERFIIENVPVIKELVPKEGLPNNWIVLKGKFLDPKMRFWIGRTPVRRQYVSDTEIKLFIHKGLKSGTLVYQWRGPKKRTKLRFKLTRVPSVKGFTPKTGWYGDDITISGMHFCDDPVVKFGGKKAPVVKSIRGRRIKTKVPKGAESGAIVVECYGKSFTVPGSLSVSPKYAEITGVDPQSGPPGAWLRVRGRGFRPDDKFWIGRARLKTKFVSPKLIRVKISPRANSGKLFFESYGKRFSSKENVLVHKKPNFRGVNPQTGWYGEEVELIGDDFCPQMKVEMRGKKIPVVDRKGSRKVTIRIPKGIRGGRFKATCFGLSATSSQVFKLEPPKSGIVSVNPMEGAPGTKLQVKGKMLSPSDVFMIGDKRMPMTYRGRNEVQLTIPRGAETGPIVHKSYGRSTRTRFVVKVVRQRPIVATFEPKMAWYGDTVVLKGRRICRNPKVMLKGKALEVLKSSSDKVAVKLPRGIQGGNLVLVCSKHKIVVRPAIDIKPPFGRIFSIHPTSGPWGTWVTLTGESFKRSDVFYLGDDRLKKKYVGSNEVRVQIPEKAKSGKIAIFSAGKRRVSKHEFKIVLVTPVVRDFSPRSGWYGDTVTLKGRHFCIEPKVIFVGGKKTVPVEERLGHTTLKVKVPQGAQTGALAVECYGRTGRSSRYFVLSPPLARVSGVKPDRGPWNRWIDIKGRNFTKKTKFYLGETRLRVKHKNSGSVQVFIPPGAKSGLLYVESFGHRKDTSFTYVVRNKKGK